MIRKLTKTTCKYFHYTRHLNHIRDRELHWKIRSKCESNQSHLELLQAGVERCCTKKNVKKPEKFKFLAETDRPKLKIDESCVGQIICCIATPINEERKDIPTISLAATAKQPVSTGPGKCPYHQRHETDILDMKETVLYFSPRLVTFLRRFVT